MHPLIIGKRSLTWGGRTYVMGILNLTPDSFSGDGLLVPASLTAEGVNLGYRKPAVSLPQA